MIIVGRLHWRAPIPSQDQSAFAVHTACRMRRSIRLQFDGPTDVEVAATATCTSQRWRPEDASLGARVNYAGTAHGTSHLCHGSSAPQLVAHEDLRRGAVSAASLRVHSKAHSTSAA